MAPTIWEKQEFINIKLPWQVENHLINTTREIVFKKQIKEL